jgi:hypothetical protein
MCFFKSAAGKGTVGVFLSCLIIVFPVVGTWLVAGLTLTFAVFQLRESFRRLDAAEEAAARRQQLGTAAPATVPAVIKAGDRRPVRSGRQG